MAIPFIDLRAAVACLGVLLYVAACSEKSDSDADQSLAGTTAAGSGGAVMPAGSGGTSASAGSGGAIGSAGSTTTAGSGGSIAMAGSGTGGSAGTMMIEDAGMR